MKYLLTLYGDESRWADITPEQMAEDMKGWDEYSAELDAAGVMVSGEGLSPSPTAKTIRLSDEHIVTDGPFAETKEQLGGYYLIEVEDMDAALEWAHKIPMPGGAVEVRAVIDYEAERSSEPPASEGVTS